MARRPTGTGTPGAGAAPELRLPVWQFVRLMVQVEESLAKGSDAAAGSLSRAWNEVWGALDGELTRLGATDSEAFAELMMDQEVVLDAVTPELARAVGQVLSRVVRTMQAILRNEPKDGQRAEDLRFEVAELKKTLKSLPGARNPRV